MYWNWPEPYDRGSMEKALKKDMTPNRIDSGDCTVHFFDPDGFTVTASYEECTCPDFRINKRGASPCKHMLRLAMETDAIPSEGMATDPASAEKRFQEYRASVAVRQMISSVSNLPIPEAVQIISQLRALLKSRKGVLKSEVSMDPFPFATPSEDRFIPTSDKKVKERFKSVESALADRLLNIALKNLNDRVLMDALKSAESE